MDAFAIGNLVGRLLMSAVLVYLLLLIFNRFDFKQSTNRMKGILPIVSVLVLFVLGLGVNAIQG